MSSTVEVYLRNPGDRWRYPADELAAVARVAQVLDVRGYFGSGMGSFTFTLEPQVGGVLSIDLRRVEHDYGTVFELYDFELSMELQNVPALARGELRERAGREVFDRLIALDVPLALGDNAAIFADFLPGRGVREFPPGTSWDEDGRAVWREPGMPSKPVVPEIPFSPQGSVRVFETNGLVQFVPWSRDGALAPVASLRASAGPKVLGRALAETLERSRQDAPTTADPWSWVTGTARLGPGEYGHAAVSIDFTVEDATVTAVPHETRPDSTGDLVRQGPAIESAAFQRLTPWDDADMGSLVLRLIDETRSRVPS